jgi:putative ABC transport system ATP-binding protein
VIYLKDIRKSFDGHAILNIPKMKFEAGKSYLLFGPSGTGKTTLLNIIAGVVAVDSGKVIVDNTDISSLSPVKRDKYRLQKVGYIFQDFKLLEDMTVRENLELIEIELQETMNFKQLLSKVSLDHKEKQKVRTLSGGEKQRLAICRAICKKPVVLLADEPTANLNSKIAQEIMTLLISLAKETEAPLLLVSHELRMLPLFDCSIDLETFGGGAYSA